MKIKYQKPTQGMDIKYTWKDPLKKNNMNATNGVYEEFEKIIKDKKLYLYCKEINLDLSKADSRYWSKKKR